MKCAVDRKVCLESQILTFCDTIRLPKFGFKDSKVAFLSLLVNILAYCVFILCIFKCICTAMAKLFHFLLCLWPLFPFYLSCLLKFLQ